MDNSKKYLTGECGVIPITGLGFRAQKLGFCVRASTVIEKDPPSEFFSNLAVLSLGRGKCVD